jgi:hypothetical protein
LLIDIVKTSAKSAAIFVMEHVKFTLTGCVVSLTMAAWTFSRVFDVAKMTGLGDFFAAFGSVRTLVWLALLVAFPVAYALYSQKRAILKVLAFVTKDKKDALTASILERFFAFAEKRSSGGTSALLRKQQDLSAAFDRFLADRQSIPGVLRKVARYLAKKADIAGMIGLTAQELAADAPASAIAQGVAAKLNPKLDELMRPMPAAWFWLLVTVNIVTFAAFRIW